MTRDEIIEVLRDVEAALIIAERKIVELDRAKAEIERLRGALESALTSPAPRVSEEIPAQYRYLKYEPKTAAENGWNARILGESREHAPINSVTQDQWLSGYDESGAFLAQEIG